MLVNCSYFLEPLFTYMFGLLRIVMSVREKPFNELLLNGWFNYITSFAFDMEKKRLQNRSHQKRSSSSREGGRRVLWNAGYVVRDMDGFCHLDSFSLPCGSQVFIWWSRQLSGRVHCHGLHYQFHIADDETDSLISQLACSDLDKVW